MDSSTRDILHNAYQRIKAGDKQGARDLIMPVLSADHDTVDAWWLAAHAARTPQDARLALSQVLRLNPEHGPARIMLDRLNARFPLDTGQLMAVELPPPGHKRRDLPASQPSSRWVWNIVMTLGCAGILFAAAALISSLMGLTWLDDSLDRVGDLIGVEVRAIQSDDLGTVSGGDPSNPHPIPIVQRKPIKPGDIAVGTLKRDEAHVWTFSLQQGANVMAMLRFTAAGDTRAVLELHDASGADLAIGTGDPSGGVMTLVYPNAPAGAYELVIIGRPAGPRGAYTLGMDTLD